MVDIDKNVPRPTTSKRAYVHVKYPFARLENGDSFALPIPKDVEARVFLQRIRSAAGGFCRRHGSEMRFTATIEIEAGKKVVRVWADKPISTTSASVDDLFS